MGSSHDSDDLDALERTIRTYLLAVVLPLWIAAGSSDYVLHRRSNIEGTSGLKESALHAVGISLAALPVVSGLFLEVNAGVLALMATGFSVHMGMTIWDVSYASTLREVTPTEQHVHAMLELVPFSALSFMLCVHHEQALALLGRGDAKPDFRLKPKRKPLPGKPVAAIIGAFTLLVAIPYVEELTRCYRYDRNKRKKTDVAD